MLALPWSKEETEKTLLEEEVKRTLRIMRDSDPTSDEYKKALVYYQRLNEQRLKERALIENRRGHWFDAFATLVLAGVTLTAEEWTPLTSKWYNTLMRPIKGHRDFTL